MDHVDAEVLALAALGEPVSAADEAHLAICERCGDEVASLERAAGLARDGGREELVAPPPAVWTRIRAELGLADATPARPADTPPAVVVPLRRRTSAWIAAAAAAGVVVGGVGATWVATRDDAPPALLAAADLAPLPGWDAAGHAEVEEAADGSRVLVLSVDVADIDGLQEVWLLKEDVSGLVSLGLLDGAEGRFVLPAGLDLAEYPVVDVSREPLDGDPAHSGDSIVRGVLDGGSLDA